MVQLDANSKGINDMSEYEDDDWLHVGDYSLDRVSPEQERYEELEEQNEQMKEDIDGMWCLLLVVVVVLIFL